MRRQLSYLAAWFAVATIALVVSWQGVSIVTRQVTTQRPASLSAAELQETISSATSSSTTVDDRSTDGRDDDGSTTTTTTSTTAQQSATATPTTTTAPPVDTAPTSGSSTTSSASTPTSTAPSSTTAAPAPATTRTYNLVGGSTALRFTSAGVSVEYATPKPGFRVSIEPEHGNGVKVEFRSDTHRSRVDGWWEGGPVDRIREEADD